MTVFDKIQSRDPKAFPFAELDDCPQAFCVDWREDEGTILELFLQATGLPRDGVSTRWDGAKELIQLVHPGGAIDIASGAGASSQHSMLMALSRVFGARASIRMLNHLGSASFVYFMALPPERWLELEAQHPLARWFFTPIELLPDMFEGSMEALEAAGRRHAEGSGA